MKLSIITITCNNLEGLKKTVNSVCSQSFFDKIEYIIIDGASSDGTQEFLSTLTPEIKWISEKDRGISHAFNKGLSKVTGDRVLCLNSGDVFVSSKTIESIWNILGNSRKDIVSFKVQVDNNTFIPAKDDESWVWDTCNEPHQGTFVAKKIYDKVGGYSEEYKIRMDYHFFARCRKHHATFSFFHDVIVKYEPGGVSMRKENRIGFWGEGLSVKVLYDLKITMKDILKLVIYRRGYLYGEHSNSHLHNCNGN